MSPIHKCCLCDTEENSLLFLTPSICLQKYGIEKSHKICQSCWWSKFAIEEKSHKCPGCSKMNLVK
jgi:hypothetical protein